MLDVVQRCFLGIPIGGQSRSVLCFLESSERPVKRNPFCLSPSAALRTSRPSGLLAETHSLQGRTSANSAKKFQCKLCHYSTNIMTNLRHHVRVHSGERPFRCSDCGKGFIQKIQMIKHNCLARPPGTVHRIRVTEKQPGPPPDPWPYEPTKRPYSCSQCGETFTREMQFLQHVVQVHTMR